MDLRGHFNRKITQGKDNVEYLVIFGILKWLNRSSREKKNARALQETGRNVHYLFDRSNYVTKMCKYCIL